MEKGLLKNLKETLNEIAGEWDGDESGIKEDRCHASSEGLELIEKLEAILEELNN